MNEYEIKEEVCCHYRNWFGLFINILLFPHLFMFIYYSIKFFEPVTSIFTVVLFVATMYYFLETINKKVILTDEIITCYDIFGHKKEYDLTEVTQIIFINSREKSILIMLEKYKFKIQHYAKNYDMFERKIAKLFGLKGYSNAGRIKFNV